MKRLLIFAALAAVSAMVAVGPSRAAPIPGGWRVSETQTFADRALGYLGIGTEGGGVGLTGLGCPFAPHDDTMIEAWTSNLTVTYKGWLSPFDEVTFNQQVLLRLHLTGTLEDAAGNTYAVNGRFTDTTPRNLWTDYETVFQGPGKVSLSGPTGRAVGTATFGWITGPDSFALIFSSTTQCTISS